MIIAWTGAHCAFAFETFLKTDESVIATQKDFVLISYYVIMMLFWTENRFSYGLKISESPIH